MLWRNFADLIGMHAVVLRSYRPLFFHLYIASYLDRENFAWACILAITSCAKKWSDRQMAKDYQRKKFDGENIDELIKIHQICQYFPYQKFALYGNW